MAELVVPFNDLSPGTSHIYDLIDAAIARGVSNGWFVLGSEHDALETGLSDCLTLDTPQKGLHMPPLTWGAQYDYSEDAVLLVLASHFYDADDYIHEYDEFQSLITGHAGTS